MKKGDALKSPSPFACHATSLKCAALRFSLVHCYQQILPSAWAKTVAVASANYPWSENLPITPVNMPVPDRLSSLEFIL